MKIINLMRAGTSRCISLHQGNRLMITSMIISTNVIDFCRHGYHTTSKLLEKQDVKPVKKQTKKESEVDMFSIGTEIPIKFKDDEETPVIKEDSEYPEWLFDIGKPRLDKNELNSKVEKGGIESLTEEEMERFKRLLSKATIKENNLRLKK